MKNVRKCNHDNGNKEAHYWDKDTGKNVPEPKSGFTFEEPCPKHGGKK